MMLTASNSLRWVLRFASEVPGSEEGLYDDSELKWLPSGKTTGDSMVTEAYIEEKIEAYNVAIEALRAHEPGSDGDPKLAKRLRDQLANKLDREINRWVAEHTH
jgi:hypothetical protein